MDREVENLSAEVVNLFLASSFSGKRNIAGHSQGIGLSVMDQLET